MRIIVLTVCIIQLISMTKCLDQATCGVNTGQLLLNANTICYSTYTDSFLMYLDTVILTPEIDYVTVSDSSVNIFSPFF